MTTPTGPRLALDCSFTGLSLALESAGTRHAFNTEIPKSSDLLPQKLQEILTASATSVQMLAQVLVTTGPGSFTGIRLGLATAEALKLLNPSLQIIGLSTLQTLALQVSTEHAPAVPFALALDAAGGQAYTQSFAPDATPLTEATCVAISELTSTPNLFASPSLFLPAKPLTVLHASYLLELAQNPGNHLPAQPVYIKPLTYKKQA